MAAEAELPTLVLVHGLKGSYLRQARREPGRGCFSRTSEPKRRYLSLWQLLRLEDDQLPLPLTHKPDGGPQLSDGLVPDGSIDELRVFGLTVESFYGPFKQRYRATRDFRDFSYDWRRELGESSQALETFLEALAKEKRGRGAQVVCHSMGALLTFSVLNRRPELFHSVLFAAGALRPGVNFLPDVSEPGGGNAMGPLNSTMMTPMHWLGWPSVHAFWPQAGELNQGKPFLSEVDGTAVVCNLHSLEDWKRLQLGPYHPRSRVPPGVLDSGVEAFLAETLARARDFRKLVVYDPSVRYPPTAVLRSCAVKRTPRGFHRPSREQPFDFGGYDLGEGDGRVSLQSSIPPQGVPVLNVLTTERTHSDVLSDVAAVDQLLNELLQAVQGSAGSRLCEIAQHPESLRGDEELVDLEAVGKAAGGYCGNHGHEGTSSSSSDSPQ